MKQQAVIFDIDGTLANCEHRKHHLLKEKKDWTSFFSEIHNDKVNEAIVSIYKAFLFNNQYKVIILTGRPERYKSDTLMWFYSKSLMYYNDVTEDCFLFRPNGDYRDDDIVKKEIYEKKIKPKYDIIFVVEDRNRVVKMWRDLGLTCLQCQEGNF